MSLPLFKVLLKECKGKNLKICLLCIQHCSKCFILINLLKKKKDWEFRDEWKGRLKERKMDIMRLLVFRGSDKKIMATLWQKWSQLNIRKTLFNHQADQTLGKFCWVLWLQKAICLGKEPKYKKARRGPRSLIG